MHGAYTTCWEMSGNGVRISMTSPFMVRIEFLEVADGVTMSGVSWRQPAGVAILYRSKLMTLDSELQKTMVSKETTIFKGLSIDALVLVVVVLVFFTSWIPFPYKLPAIAVTIIAFFWLNEKSLRNLGFSKTVNWLHTLLWSLLIFILGALIIGKFVVPILENIFGTVDYSAYGALKGNKEVVIQLWVYAMISAAFAEEVIFRGYIVALFHKYLGISRLSNFLTILAGALLFTIAHYSQGITGLISIFIVSLLFYGVYLLSRKNLYALIIGHALIDTYGLYQLYLGNF